ncbi:hypothetical protein MPSEU_000008600 [Mayamaea pseudoterrestris]|nr:hypothetical protein MPSEU_000008600 [Mayamaea pseudoterrestris]
MPSRKSLCLWLTLFLSFFTPLSTAFLTGRQARNLQDKSDSSDSSPSHRINKIFNKIHKKMNAVPSGYPFVTFDNTPFWQSQKIIFGANLLGYVINLCAPHFHAHVDLLGTGAFAAAALPSLWTKQPIVTRIPGTSSSIVAATNNVRIQASASAVFAWSVKLALFLLYRVLNSETSKDERLDAILSNPSTAAGFWLFSMAWGSICSLPHTLGATSSSLGDPLALRVGGIMAAAGWLTETIADYQKWLFKRTHKKGDFCNEGLWSVSQHPNWFGNLLFWSGIFVMNAPALVEPVMFPSRASLLNKLWGYRRVGLAMLSPGFMYYLFSSQGTGKLLPEGFEATRKRYGYGVDEAYTKYVDETPLIIPNPLQWWRDAMEAGGGVKKAQ